MSKLLFFFSLAASFAYVHFSFLFDKPIAFRSIRKSVTNRTKPKKYRKKKQINKAKVYTSHSERITMLPTFSRPLAHLRRQQHHLEDYSCINLALGLLASTIGLPLISLPCPYLRLLSFSVHLLIRRCSHHNNPPFIHHHNIVTSTIDYICVVCRPHHHPNAFNPVTCLTFASPS